MASLQLLRRLDLLDFIHSPAYQHWPVLPISRHRALSHVANPRTQDDDVLLLLAMEEGEMVGYLGVLPDEIFNGGGQPMRVGWMSCIWTHPRMRGRGIAELLVKAALRAYDGRLLATSFTPAAKKLYDKMGTFAPLARLEGYRLYRRMGLASLLAGRHPRLVPWLRLADVLGNAVADRRWWGEPKLPAGVELRFARQLSEQASALVAEQQATQLFRRRAAELNWILAYPWILESAGADVDSKRYAFSALSPAFQSGLIEVWEHDELQAVLLYQVREGHFQLPYSFFKPEYTPQVVRVLAYCWRHWKVHTVSFFQSDLASAQFSGVLLKRPFHKEYLLGCTALDGLPPTAFHLQAGDGDAAFT